MRESRENFGKFSHCNSKTSLLSLNALKFLPIFQFHTNSDLSSILIQSYSIRGIKCSPFKAPFFPFKAQFNDLIFREFPLTSPNVINKLYSKKNIYNKWLMGIEKINFNGKFAKIIHKLN